MTSLYEIAEDTEDMLANCWGSEGSFVNQLKKSCGYTKELLKKHNDDLQSVIRARDELARIVKLREKEIERLLS